jgi:hypothetical protein
MPRRGVLVLSIAGIVIEIHAVAGDTDQRVKNAKQFDHPRSFQNHSKAQIVSKEAEVFLVLTN